MNIDKFTKIILTVIAINLTILTFSKLNIIPEAYANNPKTNFELSPKINYGLVPLNEDGTINVKLNASDELNVNITGINTYDELEVNLVEINTNDELDVNIDEIGGKYVSYGDPISVEIE